MGQPMPLKLRMQPSNPSRKMIDPPRRSLVRNWVRRERLMLPLVVVVVIFSRAFAFPVVPSLSSSPPKLNMRVPISLASSLQQKNAMINIDESFPRDFATFEEWSMNCGIQKAPGVELTSTQDGLDVQFMTTQDLPTNTPILFVPNGPILSSHQIHQEEIGDGRGETIDGRPMNAKTLLNQLGQPDQFPRFCLFLKLIMEYEKGVDSPWFPWLNSLPRYFTNGASMTEFCFTCLPPLAAKLSQEERTRCNVFQQTLRQVYGNLVSEESKNNIELMRWAYNVVYTRCRVRKGEPIIIPMADYFNHATKTNAIIKYDDEGSCYTYTTADVPAGSLLTISYQWGQYQSIPAPCKIRLRR